MSRINRFSLEERDNYQNRKVIYDKDTDSDIELNNIYSIIDLLNKLDKQIVELKKQLEEKEKTIQGLIKAQEFLERSCSYQMLLDTQKENILLKQQLKSQPTEIVEKIKKQLIKRLNTIAGYGRMTIDELSFFIETEFVSDLDDILKEYQK